MKSSDHHISQTNSIPISIFIAGDFDTANEICQEYCDEVGLCVTVTETTYVYTSGNEAGVIIGLINYPRFPDVYINLVEKATQLGCRLREGLKQQSFTVQTAQQTVWHSWREDNAN